MIIKWPTCQVASWILQPGSQGKDSLILRLDAFQLEHCQRGKILILRQVPHKTKKQRLLLKTQTIPEMPEYISEVIRTGVDAPFLADGWGLLLPSSSPNIANSKRFLVQRTLARTLVVEEMGSPLFAISQS